MTPKIVGGGLPLAWASLMAAMDVLVFGMLKKYTEGLLTSIWTVPLAMALYSLQPFFFLKSLSCESMTVMNILWDIISDFMVTAEGLFYFKEKLSPLKYFGLSLAFIAIVILSYDEMRGV